MGWSINIRFALPQSAKWLSMVQVQTKMIALLECLIAISDQVSGGKGISLPTLEILLYLLFITKSLVWHSHGIISVPIFVC